MMSKTTKMYKIELYFIALNNDFGVNEHKLCIDHALDGIIMFEKVKVKDIGEWNDDSKFNFMSTPIEEFRKEFE